MKHHNYSKKVLLLRYIIWTWIGKHDVKVFSKRGETHFWLMFPYWKDCWKDGLLKSTCFSETYRCITSLISSIPVQLFMQEKILHCDAQRLGLKLSTLIKMFAIESPSFMLNEIQQNFKIYCNAANMGK